MKALLDTNVVLDVLLDRAPHAVASSAVLSLVESGAVRGSLCATSVTTVHYLLAKALGQRVARRHLETLLSLCDVAPVTEDVLRDALSAGFADYEDAVVHAAALRSHAAVIVSRDATGFKSAKIPVVSPAELLATLRRNLNPSKP